MKKFIQQKLKDQKGMTLIELLAVIVIIAIIAAIAIPAIGGIIENSRVGAMKSDNLNAIAAADLYLIDNPNDATVTLAKLVGTASTAVYLDDPGSLTAFTYTVAGKTVASSAQVNNMYMTTKGATKANIANTANSSMAETAPVAVKKGSAVTLP